MDVLWYSTEQSHERPQRDQVHTFDNVERFSQPHHERFNAIQTLIVSCRKALDIGARLSIPCRFLSMTFVTYETILLNLFCLLL